MDSTASATKDIRALLTLIVDAAHIAESHLSRSGTPAREQSFDAELRSSIHTIEAACAQLCSLVARPSDTLVNVSSYLVFSVQLSDIQFAQKFMAVSTLICKHQ